MTIINQTPSIAIRPLEPRDEERCARLMCTSEPWTTLGRFAGFIVLSLVGVLNGYIRAIVVEPSQRGRGVGSELMAFAETRIFAGSPNVFLCVTSFNDRARALYERLGYHYVGELSDFFVRGVSELLYRKTRGPWTEFRGETITPVGTTQ